MNQSDEEQRLLAFLLSPSSYPAERFGTVSEVKHSETHISHILLTGVFALKLKKRVAFDFLDFQPLAARKHCCEEEVRLNSQYSSDLYLGVVEISTTNGGFTFGEGDRVADYLVQMRQFDEAELFSNLLEEKKLDDGALIEAARLIARFHRGSAPEPSFGPAEQVEKELRKAYETPLADEITAALAKEALQRTLERLRSLTPLLEARRATHVRRIHGDLHLRNICRYDGRVHLFDGIEFSPGLGHGDVWSDTAFLVMDLIFRGKEAAAALTVNVYLEETDDYAGLALLPLFIAYRAAVRAKISLLSPANGGESDRRKDASGYLSVALKAAQAPRASPLIAIGGLSGSGKSTVSRQLAKQLGAVHIRADAVRKHIFAKPLFEKLPQEIYSKKASETTYEGILERARLGIEAGYPVVVDAVFQSQGKRAKIEAFAKAEGVSFSGYWCSVPEAVAKQRILGRQGDVSDADVKVFENQRALDTGPISWRKLDTSCEPEGTANEILRDLLPR